MPSYSLFLACIIVFFVVVYFIGSELKKPCASQEWWAPSLFICYGALISLPGRVYQSLNTDGLREINAVVRGDLSFEFNSYWVSFLYLIGFFLPLLVFRIRQFNDIGRFISKFSFFKASVIGAGRSFRLPVVMTLGGVLINLYFIYTLGGLGFLWENIEQRVRFRSGNAWLTSFSTYLSTFGFLLYLYAISRRERKNKKIVIFSSLCLFLIVAFSLSAFGARGPVISFTIMTIIAYSFWIKNITIFSKKIVLLAVVSVFFISFIGAGRDANVGYADFFSNPELYFENMQADFTDRVILRTGSFDRHFVIVSYFNDNDVWMGKGYLSLLPAPIPRSIYQNKPPVDDGVYVYNISVGRYVEPNQPMYTYIWNSWPPGNLKGFMEWHVFGYIFIILLSSIIVAALYRACWSYEKSPFWIFLYVSLASFGSVNLSVYGFVGAMTDIFYSLIVAFFLLFFGFFFRVDQKSKVRQSAVL